MELIVNMLIDWSVPDATRKTERVLAVQPARDRVILIDILDQDSMPYDIPLSQLLEAAENKDFRVLTNDPYVMTIVDSEIPEKHRRRMDRAWALIAPIVELPRDGQFDEEQRYRVISKTSSEGKASKVSIYRYLKTFWKRGQRKIGLLPNFSNCGAPGKERMPGEAKRGRPHNLSKIDGVTRGINIGPEDKRKIQIGMKLFFEDQKASNPQSLRQAYQQMLEKFYSPGPTLNRGVLTPIIPPAHEVPAFSQSMYWYRKEQDLTETLIAREGLKGFNLRFRGLGGDAAAEAVGPGSVFQIDSTPANIHLVSSLDPTRRIGRPVLYFIVDVFSRMIVGVAATLEEESFWSAMGALENALTDKAEYCARYGIEISREEWPSHHIPEALVADRGELISKNADHLVDALGIRITNTPAYRADLKPFVERSFRTFQDEVIHQLPGAVNQRRERGDEDERLSAVLTPDLFRKVIIQYVLWFNSSRIEGYRPQGFMLTDKVEPRPIDLWNWGISHRTGCLRALSSERVRINILPRSQATVTAQGIRFRKVFYTCHSEQKGQWRVRSRARHSWKVEIAYHPFNTNLLFLVTEQGFEPCKIMDVSALFASRTWSEVSDYFKGMAELKDRSATRVLQSKTDRNAQIGALVKEADEWQQSFDQPVSKAAALGGSRENRKVERDLERAGARQSSPVSAASIEVLSTNSDEASQTQNDYVPRPCDLNLLRQQRQKHQGNK
jgi:hypothetical protein